MTDTPDTASQGETQPQGAPLIIAGQYIKDLSFEAPSAPEIFSKMNQAPDIPINVDVQARHLEGNTFEIVLAFNATATVGGETAFVLELSYGAVARVNPQQPDHTQPLLLIEAPRTMFPFARNIIADTTRDGGFPPLMLQPIDFVQLYRQRMEHEGQAQPPQQ
jgi:preprotein translocase subunit SecB